MGQYKWHDLQAAASMMLLRYLDNSDLHCAEGIWKLLEAREMTKHSNELERHRVLVLLLAVVEFVNDCTALIREDSYELDLSQWASEVEINKFRIAQLIGEDFEVTEEYEEEDLVDMALTELVSQERHTIVDLIKSKYKNTMEICKFIGNFYEEDQDDDDDNSEALVELYGEPNIPSNVMEFFSWVEEGMERRS